MASNIATQDTSGVGPESAFIQEHLLDATGSVREHAQVAAELGHGQATLVLLDHLMGQRLSTPRTRGYPPRLFLSYRRESPEHIEWCVELTGALTTAGYEVHLDALAIWELESTPRVVADFVSRLADADVVVTVVTDSYLRDEHGGMRSWLWEEWSRIRTLRNWGLTEVVAVLRSGTLQEEGMVSLSGAMDAVLDLRRDPDDMAPVLRWFGTYEGPCLSLEQQRELAEGAAAVLGCTATGDVGTSERHVLALQRYAATEEYWLAVAWHARTAGDEAALLHAAEKVQRMNATLPTTFALCQCLWLADLDADAVGMLAEVAEAPSRWRQRSHSILGDIFERQGLLREAANHWRWCVRAGGDPHLGGYYSQLGREQLNYAQERLVGLEQELDTGEAADELLVCEPCGARYPLGKKVCVLCATPYELQQEVCWFCRVETIPLSSVDFCAICRKSWSGSQRKQSNSYVVPREPRGRFSVLALPVPPAEPIWLWRKGRPPLGAGMRLPVTLEDDTSRPT